MTRQWIPLSAGWKFLRDEEPDARLPEFDDSGWETVAVPHTFNAADTFVYRRGYYRGPGWYRMRLPALPAGRRIELAGLGAFALTHVWLNGGLLGRYMGGFTGFSVDLTPHFRRRGANILAIRVSNSHNPDILPGKDIPDYDLYGGIYREIGLRVTDPLHIDALIASTPEVTRERGAVHLNVRIANDRRARAEGAVAADLVAPDGAVVASGVRPFVAAPGAERIVHVPLPPVEDPALWSPDSPRLYTIRVRLLDGNEVVDADERTIGFRFFAFDAERGFILNGEPLRLRGANRHQDLAGIGSAIPANLQPLDAELLRWMGCNFVRCSHYPMHPAFLDACDRLGLLVYAEIASWQHIGGEEFAKNAETMMREMIERDRHHPSIILWGLLNEGRSVALFRRLNAVAKRHDPWRPTIYAENNPEEGAKLGTIEVPDVIGLNYKVPHLDELRAGALAGRKVLSSEHSNPNIGERFPRGAVRTTDWVDDQIWQMDRVLHDLDEYAQREWIAGTALWCMHDYGTDYAPSWPMHESGVIDAWRIAKFGAWAMRARWNDEPTTFIAGHWTWPGRDGEKIRVVVLSNAREVELYRNNRSFGTQRTDDARHPLEWTIPYEPGSIVAVGRDARGKETRDARRTAAGPAAIAVEPLHGALRANAMDATLLTATIVDAAGIPVPTATTRVRFSVAGDAAIFAFGGGAEVATRAGRERVVLRAGSTPGTVRVTASGEGLKAGTCDVVIR